MAKHLWLRKPTQRTADALAGPFKHALDQGCSLTDAMTFAGSWCEQVQQGRPTHYKHRDRASIERGLKASTQRENYLLVFMKHRALLAKPVTKAYVKPLAEVLGIPGAPWQIVVDKLIDLGRDGEANTLRSLFADNVELASPITPTKRPTKPKLPIEVRRVYAHDVTTRDRYDVLVTFSYEQRNEAYGRLHQLARAETAVALFAYYDPNHRKTTYGNTAVSRGYQLRRAAMMRAWLVREGFKHDPTITELHNQPCDVFTHDDGRSVAFSHHSSPYLYVANHHTHAVYQASIDVVNHLRSLRPDIDQ